MNEPDFDDCDICELKAKLEGLPPGWWLRESDLQESIAIALGGAAEREARLDDGCRIDFLAGDIGIEVKTGGSRADLILQLRRYARTGKVSFLLVVTTKRTLAFSFVRTIESIPVEVLVVGGGF